MNDKFNVFLLFGLIFFALCVDSSLQYEYDYERDSEDEWLLDAKDNILEDADDRAKPQEQPNLDLGKPLEVPAPSPDSEKPNDPANPAKQEPKPLEEPSKTPESLEKSPETPEKSSESPEKSPEILENSPEKPSENSANEPAKSESDSFDLSPGAGLCPFLRVLEGLMKELALICKSHQSMAMSGLPQHHRTIFIFGPFPTRPGLLQLFRPMNMLPPPSMPQRSQRVKRYY